MELIADGIALAVSFDDKQREKLGKDLGAPIKKVDFKSAYQQWFTKATAVVRDVLPHRLADFRTLYQLDKRRNIDLETYGISDYLVGISLVRHNSIPVVRQKFRQQFQILMACQDALDSALLNIQQLVHADFLDSEIAEARELHKRGFLRAAGAVAGVALEKHLAMVLKVHSLVVKKKDPTIGDLNDALKAGDVYDIPTWRFVLRLGDLRNLCDHNKQREPTPEEVLELIGGVDKTVKTVH